MSTIVTLSEFRTYMRGNGGSFDDADLQSALDAGERSVRTYCGRDFAVAGGSSARTYVPSGCAVQRIHDCTTVTSISLAGTTIVSTDWQAEVAEGVVGVGWDGLAEPFQQVRRLLSTWLTLTPGKADLSVTATWGWAAVPADVKEAVKLIGKDVAEQRNVRFGVAGFDGFGAVRIRQNATAAALLAPFRRIERFGLA